MWFSTSIERVRTALDDALAWCDHVSVIADADTPLLRTLRESGKLRQFADGDGPRTNFVWFERGDDVRFLLAPGGGRGGAGMWMFWEGQRSEVPEGLQAIFDACWTMSAPADAAEPEVAPYSRPIPSVREVLGIRSTRDFFELEEEDQERALWSALIGEGAVDLEHAIRLCAERLRAQGFLEYQLLRQDGQVYAAIEGRLLAARRSTDLFDRPRNGFVRAIQSNLDALTAEQWRDCLMGALEVGQRVDRDQAVRLGFDRAQEAYGVNVQRLRGGGRADQALRSAINSSLRQGYLDRDGAVYLIRVSELAPPTLRGTLTDGEKDIEASQDPVAAERAVASEAALVSAQVAPVVNLQSSVEVHLDSATGSAVVDPLPASGITERASTLDQNLWELEFPTRTLHWAERQKIETIRGLVSWDPEVFATERNVGRRTVRETRELLAAHLGYSWEEAHAAVQGRGVLPPRTGAGRGASEDEVDGTTEALTDRGATGWAALAATLTEEQRATSVLDVALPTRMKNFVRAEGIQALGDLFRLSHAALAGAANLGRKSLNDTIDAVRDYFETASAPACPTFFAAWQAQLSVLEPIPRMIVTRRAGMHGNRETLEELGNMLGVTRERVRQIEVRVIERLRERSRWRRLVEGKVTAAFGAGRAVPLDLLAQDPWWAGIDHQELLLDYVVRRVFEDELFLFEAPSGRRYLARFSSEEFTEHLESAKRRVAKLEYPTELTAIEDILRAEVASLDSIVFRELESAVGELLHVNVEKPGMALGYGRHRNDEVIAFLGGQAEAVSIAVLEEKFGRGHLPDEVIYFKRGVVGLKRHFPDFDGWTERLVPAALDVMKERPAGRQWLVPEIHDALRERGVVPDWLGHWHLASLLRRSGQVDYLGRLRVAAKDSGHEQRLHYEELFEQLLEQAGAPLDFQDLLARARVQTDVGESTATLMVAQAPFVRIDERRVGLVGRDIPGGPGAVAAAIEAVVASLTETQHGLTPHQATQLVNRLSSVHATWSRQLVTSVLRNETSVRIDRSKNIGLDAWDDVRCPTRPEFVRREVQRAGGTLQLRELVESLDRFYGRAPDRGTLGVIAEQVGLTIAGDRIFRPGSASEAAPVSRGSINLTGIPTELREMFEEMMQEPFRELAELRREIESHVEAIEEEHHVNEFVDLPGARVLARQCHGLLDRWDSLTVEDRHVAHAAVRYFVSWDDVENDFDIGGLDDDKQIMEAVLLHLGIQERMMDGAVAS